MNSYQLISKLRKVRGRIYLTTAAQALYHELVAICNDMKWKEVFFIRSNILCGNLDISDNTLRKSRDSLSDAGLLFYRPCKDKRIGCYYSFSQKISDEVLSSATSSANFEDETQITPIKDNINIKQEESLARTHENPPPEKPKKSRKKEGDVKPLVYPFSSIAFMSAWETLRNTPKWKNKLNYALQLSLNKLSNFEEEFAIRQIERAIESGWTGVVFTGTERDYQEWLNIKYGKTGIQGQNNRNADKAAKARMLLDEYAAIEQGNSAINHQAEIPDL